MEKDNKPKFTWEELVAMEAGTIVEDYYDDGVRILIVRGPADMCVYLGMPEDHPISGFDYDSLPVEAHGGLTFCGSADYLPEGYYWYGFDYGHSGDYSFYYDTIPINMSLHRLGDKKWLVEDIKKDIWSAVYSFKQIASLAEKIVSKKYKIAKIK